MANYPLVSIYIPTHNRCDLLKRAVESVFQQTYSNIELLIVDDASLDDTYSYLKALKHDLIDIKVFRLAKPQGACAARNLAIQHAQGQFVTGLDDDDEFMSRRITDLVANYDANYAFICVGFLWDYGKKSRRVDHTNKIITLNEQLNYNYATNQVLVETERLRSINGFDENFVACQDYDTWTRLIEHFGNAKRISGASYIIHRGDNIKRLTEPTNWLNGHTQFVNKHGSKMTRNNILNQTFRRMIATREKLGIIALYQQLKAGLVTQKIRYFLSSNFAFINKLRRNTLG